MTASARRDVLLLIEFQKQWTDPPGLYPASSTESCGVTT